MVRKILFIGGAPTVGKTTIAKKLSIKYRIPWISTDLMREWMCEVVSINKYPDLFLDKEHTAESFWTKYYSNIKGAIAQEKKRDIEVFKGVKKFLEENNYWDSYILEGISIHPEMIREIKKMKDIEFTPIFLIQNGEKIIKKVAYERGLWGEANSYEDWVKEKEIRYIKLFNDWYKKECIKNKVEFIELKGTKKEIFKKINSIASKVFR